MIRLIEHVVSLPTEELEQLAVQDIALCKVWYEASNGSAGAVEGATKIPELVGHWLEKARPDAPETEGRRHQTLLRDLIDRLRGAQVGSMARDELDLIHTVFDLIQHAADPQPFERVEQLLKPHMKIIKKRQGLLMPDPKLRKLCQTLHIVNTEDILKSRVREVRVLAGIPLPSRGPLLTHQGHVRVLGDVPEDCTIVVEAGHCVVDGFVMGRIAATGQCEVLENIAGVVITRDGDIRARNIVDNAHVIAKLGRVYCRRAQNPTIVFSGLGIEIRDESVQGRYLSSNIEIGEEALGGEFHISESIQAHRFRQSESRPLSIVFRNGFSCKDYGEIPGREMARLLSKAMRLRRQLNYAKQVRDLANREAEQIASNVLMFLLGGEAIKKILDDTVKAQSRLNVLNRIILGLYDLYVASHNDVDEGDSAGPEEGEFDLGLFGFEEEVADLQPEGGIDADLREEHDNITQMEQELVTAKKERKLLPTTQLAIQRRLANWIHESRELTGRIQQNERSIQQEINWTKLVPGDDEATKLVMLRRLLVASKNDKLEGPIPERIRSSYVSLMLRLIRSRVEKATRSRKSIQALRTAFKEASEEIWNAYQVRLTEDEDDPLKRATATGRYGTNVKLYADKSLVGSDDAPPKGRYIVTPGDPEREVTYAYSSGIIAEAVEAKEAE